MDFRSSPRASDMKRRVRAFIQDEILPRHPDYLAEMASGQRWKVLETIESLKIAARSAGLWNLFLPPAHDGADDDHVAAAGGERLTNLEYALCAEEMGRLHWASEIFNCSAPDSGNMETLRLYGTPDQKVRWLAPLLDGDIRSAFLMTEPHVASSDATNIETSIVRDGADYILNGRKWWSSGVGDPRCRLAIVMGKSDREAAAHAQQSMILLDLATPGVRIERMLSVFGYDHAPHGHAEIVLDNVRVPAGNILLGKGRGFEIAQGRLGPGRIHHCMRTIGAAEEALDAMTRRLLSRTAFGKRIGEHSVWEARIARARIDIEMTRLLGLKAADLMDRAGNKAARNEIAMIKVQAPRMALRIIDDAIQAYGGAGVSDDTELAASWAHMRTMRLADGPDEVHARAIARAEFARVR